MNSAICLVGRAVRAERRSASPRFPQLTTIVMIESPNRPPRQDKNGPSDVSSGVLSRATFAGRRSVCSPRQNTSAK
jgi:hypothetical protein